MAAFGGLAVCVEFLRRIGYAEAAARHMRFQLRSPNVIDPVGTFTASVTSVLAGAREGQRPDVAGESMAGVTSRVRRTQRSW